LVKIVNGLTAKAESPGPMTCAHLLGHPDHYTPETFRVFYWWPFAKHVEDTSLLSEGGNAPTDSKEKVVLSYKQGRIVGRNQIQDYILRPLALQELSLYDFMCTTVVKKITKQHQDSEAENNDSDEHDEGSDQHCDTPVAKATKTSQYHRFHPEHPLYETHGVFVGKDHRVLLNFVGGVLPRRDRDDHEAYCRVMLTIFSPHGWRTGADLKSNSELWSDVFKATAFKASHVRIMDNMNLLYECYDAKHDWSA
ncbi:hypothetical protein BDW22DRAFT_1298949, partial [Trametopsis cervina]